MILKHTLLKAACMLTKIYYTAKIQNLLKTLLLDATFYFVLDSCSLV